MEFRLLAVDPIDGSTVGGNRRGRSPPPHDIGSPQIFSSKSPPPLEAGGKGTKHNDDERMAGIA